MKKLMVFSVILALLAGSVFAVDLGGEVIGTYVLVGGDTDKDANGDSTKPYTGGSMNRIRLQGDGENDDGTFGAWLRFEMPPSWGADFDHAISGNVWWKPIDQFLIRLGSNGGDGFWGKEPITGWMFRQRINDSSVVSADEAWGSDYTQGIMQVYMSDPSNPSVIGYDGLVFRHAFYGGYGDNRLALEIRPMDMLGINIALPFGPDESENIFKAALVQLDLNLDFGNIALTFQAAKRGAGIVPNSNSWEDQDADLSINTPRVYAFFELSSIENLTLDVGLGFPFPVKEEEDIPGGDTITTTYQAPIAAGVGLKFDVNDAFGLKFRAAAAFGGKVEVDVDGVDPYKMPLQLIANVLPYYTVSDSVKVFFDVGLNMTSFADNDKDIYGEKPDTLVGWHINPYIWVGEEWGPSFWAGIRVWSDGAKVYGEKGDAAKINFEVPIAIGVSF